MHSSCICEVPAIRTKPFFLILSNPLSRNIRGEKLNNPRDSDDSRSVKNFIVDAMNFEHTYSVFLDSDNAFLMEANLSISVAEASTKTYLNAFITLANFSDTLHSWMHSSQQKHKLKCHKEARCN